MSVHRGDVLVAEDDLLIALALEQCLQGYGWEAVELVTSVAEGLAVLDGKPPALALVDLQLTDGRATPLIEALAAAAVPFLILTGYPCDGLTAPALRNAPCLTKPCSEEQLQAALQRVLATA
jgi:CheY-like chemotaxis protein